MDNYNLFGTGRSTAVGKIAGITNSISGIIKILDEPKIYSYDTPGILIPHTCNIERLLKIAITGGIPDYAVLKEDIAHYLFYILNKQNNTAYLDHYGIMKNEPPTTSIHAFLDYLCTKNNIFFNTGKPNIEEVCIKFLNDFRRGTFGKFTLDNF